MLELRRTHKWCLYIFWSLSFRKSLFVVSILKSMIVKKSFCLTSKKLKKKHDVIYNLY